MPELVPSIINVMKLYPCWSGIMTTIFGFGEATVSSSRIESNFNQIKNDVFKTENLPIRVDNFVEKLKHYYRGDHLLTANLVSTIQQGNNKLPNIYCNKQKSTVISFMKNQSRKNIPSTYNANNNVISNNLKIMMKMKKKVKIVTALMRLIIMIDMTEVMMITTKTTMVN